MKSLKIEALRESASFEEILPGSGIERRAEMNGADARTPAARHAAGKGRQAHRLGQDEGKLGFHGASGIERPRFAALTQGELFRAGKKAMTEDWLVNGREPDG